MFESAAELEKYGLKTFALARNSKVPSKGYKWRQMLEEPLQARFSGLVGYNIGIATGQISGVIGVDLDHGASQQDLALFPRTWRVRSRDGYHIYFKYTPRLKKGIQPLFGGTSNAATAHVRGNGHYFVAPPSVVSWCEKTNQPLEPWEYRWDSDAGGGLRPGECELAEAPPWMLRCFDHEKPFEELPDDEPDVSPHGGSRDVIPGERHHDLLTYGRWLWDHTHDETIVEQKLRERNASYQEPKPPDVFERELKNMLQWFRARIGALGRLAQAPQEPPIVLEEKAAQQTPIDGDVEKYVRPLGYNGRKYYFISRSNYSVLSLGSTALCSPSLTELMPLEFWQHFFPKRNKEGAVISANWVGAGSFLMERCRQRGIFNRSSAARGCGVWEVAENKLVYHRGDEVISQEGEARNLLEASSNGIVFTRDRVLPPFATEELTCDEGRQLVEACNTLQWRAPKSALIVAGWLATAPLCGALRKRPHLELIAPPGVGKTAFVDAVVTKVFGKRAIVKRGSESTEAGIRQDVRMAAMPVVCDDIELSEDNERTNHAIERVIVLARSSYDATPDNLITKGTADGEGQQFRCVSSFMMCAVASPLREPQDRSRFLSVLARRESDPVKQAQQYAAAKEAYRHIDDKFGARLLTRMMRRWEQFRENVTAIQVALSGNCPGRLAENIAVVLAGTATVTSDEALTLEQARELVDGLEFQALNRAEEETLEEKCLGSVLAHRISIAHKDTFGRIERTTVVSVAQAIERILDASHESDEGRVERADLQGHGFDVVGDYLIVRTNNADLKKTLPRNQAGQFGQLLALLPGASRIRHRFGGRYARVEPAVRIPLQTQG
jgi:hypothetical protein